MSLAIGISRPDFFFLKPKAASRASRGYGTIPLFDPTEQPPALQEKLDVLRKPFCRTTTFDEIVRRNIQRARREHLAGLFDQALAPRCKAQATMRALHRYFRAADSGWPQWKAAREASAEFVRQTGSALGERQIRRIARRVDRMGGPELAPLDAYRDFRSVPHKRATKAQKTDGTPKGDPTR